MGNRRTYIWDGARTSYGKFFGALKDVPAPVLGSTAIRAILKKNHSLYECIDVVFMGQVLTAGVGQNPARQAALLAGLPTRCHAESFGLVCASSLAALSHAHRIIQLGEAECVIAGGMESMSNAPGIIRRTKKLSGDHSIARLLEKGDATPETIVIDSMLHDGLTEPSDPDHASMGMLADMCARERDITRDAQERFSYTSFMRAYQAEQRGWLREYITSVSIDDKVHLHDEGIRYPQLEDMRRQKPAFSRSGSVTASTSSQIADGASALVLASGFALGMDKSIKPLARIVACASYSGDPLWFTTAPIGAIKSVLKKAGLSVHDIDLFEINEAFAVVPLITMRELGIAREQVNIWGGAIARGHPLGASGTGILGALALQLRALNRKYGIAVACHGGGGAVAVLIESV